MSHAELSNLRIFLGGAGVSFGGERKVEERRDRVLAWAKKAALESRMSEHGFTDEEKAAAHELVGPKEEQPEEEKPEEEKEGDAPAAEEKPEAEAVEAKPLDEKGREILRDLAAGRHPSMADLDHPEYHRIAQDDEGVWRVPDRGIARRHRLGIGTIVSDAAMQVKYMSGAKLGTIEEGFIARLRKGDHFVFAGRLLEYVRTQDMAAYVRRATQKSGIVPTWNGGKMPLSSELADATLEALERARQGDFFEPELQAAQPMLNAQTRLSKLPTPGTLLLERGCQIPGREAALELAPRFHPGRRG
jgi:hypothetical protein